jgi:5-methyltetrahydrofolate--homocysteine methyltransferase
MATAGRQVFALVRRLREELKVNTICGASNISFGLPNREGINAAFLPMAIASGLTSAITNPLAADVKAAIMAADVLMGNDQDAARWIRAHRDAAAADQAAARRPAAKAPPELVALPGGVSGGASGSEPGPLPGNRPRINRRALAAAAAMRDAGQRG